MVNLCNTSRVLHLVLKRILIMRTLFVTVNLCNTSSILIRVLKKMFKMVTLFVMVNLCNTSTTMLPKVVNIMALKKTMYVFQEFTL
ncbi:uncharacterized protein EV154DRAFT_509655 [Mucor mucedo]|uniref:uncharacterized protein n=1 Tax=Mucor mucedo TaxID=29922 RepID=UPI00221EEB8A|nr:uncharacterized protein EV154DRAFT_509655 [Mucor mucedo]KAI7890992.1 hypothetical protein EV154DRAFT_509655 [Mucor mucedo]